MNITTPHPVTLRQMQYLLAVGELRSFRKAAALCKVAQPSLSAQIAQVEEQLGVQIFERDRRSVTVTTAGQSLLDAARAVLLAAETLQETVRTLSDPFQSALRIGIIPTMGPYLLPEIAATLREHFARSKVQWFEDRTSALLAALRNAELDAALVAVTPEMRGLAKMTFGRDEFVFAASPSHAMAKAKSAIALEALDQTSVLLLEDGHCFREQALAYCARAGAVEVGFRATSLPTLVQMVAGGSAVTLLPRMAVDLENRTHALRVREFSGKVPFRTVAMVWRKQSALDKVLRQIGTVLKTELVARRLVTEPD